MTDRTTAVATDRSHFHTDELTAQQRAGGGATGAGIRAFMPEQHRSFFGLLPYVFLGTVDEAGWPLATMLTGEPGFVQSPENTILRIAALPETNDPARATVVPGRDIGVLGIDFATRRRNRVNGQIVAADALGLTVGVRQSFGNCAKYIQGRAVSFAEPAEEDRPAESFDGVDQEARDLIGRADMFLVASRSRELGRAGGADVSHRGGRPGFVQVDGSTLRIPDFKGNHYFNTLGNLLGEPRAGLLFMDFERGDLLQLQGRAAIDWSGDAGRVVEGAERFWMVRVVRGWRRRAAVGLHWSTVEYSPFTLETGTWVEATKRVPGL
jgi:predicted pyridoxine 5'-phosphate oxidase superfamily flavin-nucleotide-binding protein